MKHIHRNILLPLILIVSSCSSSRTVKCEEIDWFNAGMNDAKTGKGKLAYSVRAGICLGDGDKSAYTKGRKAGRIEYCTKKGLLNSGVKGQRYIHPCENDQAGKLYSYFRKGRNIFITRNRIEDNKTRLDELLDEYKYTQYSSEEKDDLEERIQSHRKEIQLDEKYLNEMIQKYTRSKLLEEDI